MIGRLKRISVLPLAFFLLSPLLAPILTSGAPTAVDSSGEIPGTKTFDSRLLEVPYVPQGATSWCFEASLDMVLRYWGKEVDLQDVAGASGHGTTTSNSLLDVFFGWVHGYISGWPDLAYSHDIRGWGFDRYQAEIEGARPVIASTFGLPGHTVVVVGYSLENGRRYLYLHDPSGYLTKLRWGTGAVAYAKVSWEQFSRLNWIELVIGLY